MSTLHALAAAGGLLAAAVLPHPQGNRSIPSVVVTFENAQPSRGVFLTPPWIGAHDGSFDLYDVGAPAGVPLGRRAIENLAEDGDNGPLGSAFGAMQPGAPQLTAVLGPHGPLAPGDRASATLNLDPTTHRYFSFAAMVIPSNDAFVGNGDPLAHPLFDASGAFVAEDFLVSGDEANDAGTEVNTELAGEVAFLGQAGPNRGPTENGVVTSPHPGFAVPGALSYPNGVLNHVVFALGDFNDADDRLLAVRFRYVDLGRKVRFAGGLTPTQEVQAELVGSAGRGAVSVLSFGAEELRLVAHVQGLTGPPTGAHLHLAPFGSNGPVVLDLGAGIQPTPNGAEIRFRATAADLTGPLAGSDLLELVNELAADGVYLNVHTNAYPMGEVRGQLSLEG